VSRRLAAVLVATLLVGCGTQGQTPPGGASANPTESTLASSSPSAGPAGFDGFVPRTLLRTLAQGLRMRSSPNTTADIVATLPLGVALRVVGGPAENEGHDWYQVEMGGLSGWVASGSDRDWLAVIGNGRIGFACTSCGEGETRAFATVNPDGSDRQAVLDEFAWPSWAPDGSRVAVVLQPPNTSGELDQRVQILSADGELLRDLGRGNRPVWSPDGSRLAFIDTAAGTVVLVDGDAAPVGLTVTDRFPPLFLAWSPDGSQLAFSAVDCPECPPGGIVGEPPVSLFVFEPPGGAVRKVVQGGSVAWPRWSPDGTSIAYAGYNLSNGMLEASEVLLADGSVRLLFSTQGIGYGFDLSPDGSRIVIGTESGIVVADPDGTDAAVVVPVMAGANLQPSSPRWSPDGDWILFDMVATGGEPIYAWVARVDGAQAHPLGDSDGYFAGWQTVLSPLRQ
jgi:Tol biopolymer transport system component